jgi:hypothetical protein
VWGAPEPTWVAGGGHGGRDAWRVWPPAGSARSSITQSQIYSDSNSKSWPARPYPIRRLSNPSPRPIGPIGQAEGQLSSPQVRLSDCPILETTTAIRQCPTNRQSCPTDRRRVATMALVQRLATHHEAACNDFVIT